jgi:hypothetical protein
MSDQSAAFTIFVSYSRSDVSLINPIVRLLQAVPGAGVFQDLISTRPGKKWRPLLIAALDSAPLVVVFWCVHSCASDEVAKECAEAIERKKDIVPVLLDDTPLSPDLSQYEWVDFRQLAAGIHGHYFPRIQSLVRSLWYCISPPQVTQRTETEQRRLRERARDELMMSPGMLPRRRQPSQEEIERILRVWERDRRESQRKQESYQHKVTTMASSLREHLIARSAKAERLPNP